MTINPCAILQNDLFATDHKKIENGFPVGNSLYQKSSFLTELLTKRNTKQNIPNFDIPNIGNQEYEIAKTLFLLSATKPNIDNKSSFDEDTDISIISETKSTSSNLSENRKSILEETSTDKESKKKNDKKMKKRVHQRNKEVQMRIYIDQLLDTDILCGRGGKSNHHPGNKRYRQVVNDMKLTYKTTEKKLKKTHLSSAVIDYVYNYGGRFIKKDEKTNRYFLLSHAEARRKTSQALREHKDIKWTK